MTMVNFREEISSTFFASKIPKELYISTELFYKNSIMCKMQIQFSQSKFTLFSNLTK